MKGYDASEDHRPVTWLRGHPIYAADCIVLVFVGTMLATTVAMASGFRHLLFGLPFTSVQVLAGEVWRVVTYGLVNPPSLWFVVDMFMIVWFGRELERFFGRAVFLRFYGCLYLLTPLLFTAIGVWWPMELAGESGAFALFIAFATLYPNTPLLFNVLAKWLAAILVGIYTLMAMASNDWPRLISLWATVGFAYGMVRYEQGSLVLPRMPWPRRKPHLRALPNPPLRPRRARDEPSREVTADVDALLDKIAKSGMASLTTQERATLEKVREALLKKPHS